MLALHWTALGFLNPTNETRHYFYVPRFMAFGLTAWGVIRKYRKH